MTEFTGSAYPDVDAHLRDVRTFVAVAEHLHFSRAADTLFISQPALSKRIQELERLMGLELFDRDRRTVRLTAAGEALLPEPGPSWRRGPRLRPMLRWRPSGAARSS